MEKKDAGRGCGWAAGGAARRCCSLRAEPSPSRRPWKGEWGERRVQAAPRAAREQLFRTDLSQEMLLLPQTGWPPRGRSAGPQAQL